MAGINNAAVQEEINCNMSFVSNQTDLQNEEELLFQAKQNWINSRVSRKKNAVPKHEQQKNTMDWVKKSSSENILDLQANEAKNSANVGQWVDNRSQDLLKSSQGNNKSSSENIDTIRENMRNSQESLKQGRNNEMVKENLKGSQELLKANRTGDNAVIMRENFKNMKTVPSNVTISIQDRQNIAKSELYKASACDGSQDSLNSSCTSLSNSMGNSFRGAFVKDAHTYAIDLSNNCRDFYFSHQRKAEAIKQSIRASKHKKALEKMEGKQPSSIDNAMERLRSEMADLMEQDLSLMSQLLKLNDKIEEVKTRVTRRDSLDTSSCYLTGEESEISDCEDSRLDVSTNSFTSSKPPKPVPPPKPVNHKVSPMHRTVDEAADSGQETDKDRGCVTPEPEALPRKIAPTERDIIVYRKKVKKRRRSSKTRGASIATTDSDTETGSSDTCSGSSDVSDNSDTESTISYRSGSGNSVSDTEAGQGKPETGDSGIQSPASNKPVVPPKPVKGGISMNSNFRKFHQKNGGIRGKSEIGSVLTLQGHNIPIAKYYVPQGLVYLKHTQDENVFCQFSH